MSDFLESKPLSGFMSLFYFCFVTGSVFLWVEPSGLLGYIFTSIYAVGMAAPVAIAIYFFYRPDKEVEVSGSEVRLCVMPLEAELETREKITVETE